MTIKHNSISDIEIISMIEQNDDAGWKNLYDKYALTMYVGVLWVVDDEIFAKNILTQLFNLLKTDKTLLCTKKTLCSSLLHYTYAVTYKILRDINNTIVIKKRKDNKVFLMYDNMVYKSYARANVVKREDMRIEKGVKRLYSDLCHKENRNMQKNKPQKLKKSQEDLWLLTKQNEERMTFKVLD